MSTWVSPAEGPRSYIPVRTLSDSSPIIAAIVQIWSRDDVKLSAPFIALFCFQCSSLFCAPSSSLSLLLTNMIKIKMIISFTSAKDTT